MCDTGCRVNGTNNTDLNQQLQTCHENRRVLFTKTFLTKKNKQKRTFKSSPRVCGRLLKAVDGVWILEWLKTFLNPKHTPDGWGGERQQLENWKTCWHFFTTYGWTKDHHVTDVDVRSEGKKQQNLSSVALNAARRLQGAFSAAAFKHSLNENKK